MIDYRDEYNEIDLGVVCPDLNTELGPKKQKTT